MLLQVEHTKPAQTEAHSELLHCAQNEYVTKTACCKEGKSISSYDQISWSVFWLFSYFPILV
jgi:hypothetical protein